MTASGHKWPFRTSVAERQLWGGDFNRSMQHLSSNYRAEDVAHEAETEDLLQHRAEELDEFSIAYEEILDRLLWVISRRSVYLTESLLSGAYQPLKVNIEKTANLSVCFHRKRSFTGYGVSVWLLP